MNGLILLLVTSATNEGSALGYFGMDEMELAFQHVREWGTKFANTPYLEVKLQFLNTDSFDAARVKLNGKSTSKK